MSGKTWTKDQEKVIDKINERLDSLELSVETLRKEVNSRINALESNIMSIFKLNGFKMK